MVRRDFRGMIAMTKVILIASGDQPNIIVQRVLRRRNFGLWCSNRACGEFFAFALEPIGVQRRLDISFASDGPIPFECPFCGSFQKREPSEIADIVLTRELKKRPPPPKGAH
jgi:hypothetical protein